MACNIQFPSLLKEIQELKPIDRYLPVNSDKSSMEIDINQRLYKQTLENNQKSKALDEYQEKQLKELVGEIFALGVKIGKDKAAFKNPDDLY